MAITIRELNTLDEMLSAYPLVHQMYDKMDFATYQNSISEMIRLNNFKMIAAFLDEKMVGACGYWIFLMLYCGRYIQASNLVVDSEMQSRGIGKKILEHLEIIGKNNACEKIVLDSYTENKRSHPLYFREGFHIRGFHFMKNL
jgi:ribosomal protein S18 acetylase RimI-like enzyme